jgi:hypothetical protein
MVSRSPGARSRAKPSTKQVANSDAAEAGREPAPATSDAFPQSVERLAKFRPLSVSDLKTLDLDSP